jgi:sulfite reductase (NADPH) flavoprotein alpha-component
LLKKTENALELISLIDAGAHIYVCGATAMGDDVLKAVIEVVSLNKAFTKAEAEKYVKGLQTSGRYVQELWTA